MRRTALPCLVVALVMGTALAGWGAWGSPTSGSVRAAAARLSPGNVPATGSGGSTVDLSWVRSHTTSGVPATGYVVARYAANGAKETIPTGSCASTVSGSTCSETSVPDGTWSYTVTPTIGSWRGAESARSTVTVGAAVPTAVTFPTPGAYNAAGYLAGCGTPSNADLCGTAAAGASQQAVVSVRLSLQDTTTGSFWTGSAFGSSSEVLLDVSGTTTWSYDLPFASFPSQGRYLLRVQATDAAGSIGTASTAFDIDSTAPPAPQLTQTPTGVTSSTTAALVFTNEEPDVGHECRLDGAAYVPCGSPQDYSGLADGSHTFDVRAVDAAGNLGAPTSRTWTVDTTAPSTTSTYPATGASYNNARLTAGCGTASVGDLCGTTSDSGSGVSAVRLSIQKGSEGYWNGSAFSSAFEVMHPVTGSTSWSYPMAATSFPAEGSYTLRVEVTDAAGNVASTSAAFVMDRTAPTAPAITGSPGAFAGSSASFSFTAETGAATQCALDAGAYTACTSPQSYSGLADGAHTFQVRAVDPATNTGTATSYSWTVDTSAPALGLTFPVHGTSYNAAGWNPGCGTATTGDVCGTASDTGSGVSSVRFSLQQGTGKYWDGTGFTSLTEVLLTPTGTTSWSALLGFASLTPDGSYTLRARATNGAGLTSTATSTFTADTTAPVARDIQTVNAGIAGRPEQNDRITYSYSEQVNPGSIMANLPGWNGSLTNVQVRFFNNGTMDIFDTAGTTRLGLGTVTLGRSDYNSSLVNFGSAGAWSTMVLNGDTVTVTLGAVSNAGAVGTGAGAGTLSWAVPAGVKDLAGNTSTAQTFTEPGAADVDF